MICRHYIFFCGQAEIETAIIKLEVYGLLWINGRPEETVPARSLEVFAADIKVAAESTGCSYGRRLSSGKKGEFVCSCKRLFISRQTPHNN
jgi:hypothetical protein